MLDETLKHIFKGVYERYGRALSVIKQHFPHDDLPWLDETPSISFARLCDSVWQDDNGNPPCPNEDLHPRDKIRLGKHVKEKHKTNYYVHDKSSASTRLFYTMPYPIDDT